MVSGPRKGFHLTRVLLIIDIQLGDSWFCCFCLNGTFVISLAWVESMVHHVQDPELLFEMMIYATFTLPDDISNST